MGFWNAIRAFGAKLKPLWQRAITKLKGAFRPRPTTTTTAIMPAGGGATAVVPVEVYSPRGASGPWYRRIGPTLERWYTALKQRGAAAVRRFGQAIGLSPAAQDRLVGFTGEAAKWTALTGVSALALSPFLKRKREEKYASLNKEALFGFGKKMAKPSFFKELGMWLGLGALSSIALSPLDTALQKKRMRELAQYEAKLRMRYGPGLYSYMESPYPMQKTSMSKLAGAFDVALWWFALPMGMSLVEHNMRLKKEKEALRKMYGSAWNRVPFQKVGSFEFVPTISEILDLIKKIFGFRKVRPYMVTPNLAALRAALLKKHPDWDKNEVDMYLATLKRYVPYFLSDMVVLDAIMTRIMNYGGLDPSFLKQLVDMHTSLENGR